MRKSTNDKPKIAIALGSGAARGWSHIGVFRGLMALDIEPEIIAGSSVGALVGAAYAADQIVRLEEWARALDWKGILKYLDPSLLGGGLIEGEKLSDLVGRYVKDLSFEDLPRRLGVVATELETGREIWFREGPVIEAVRASIGLPGLFTPLQREGRWLVDGGLTNPVPVSLCKAMGADIVIAVNLNGDILGRHFRHGGNAGSMDDQQEKTDIWERIAGQVKSTLNTRKEELFSRLLGQSRNSPGLYDVIASSINVMQDRITRSRMAGDPPDIIITPRLSNFGLMEFDRAAEAIEEGRAAVERMRPALETLLSHY
ncbi:MAG: patatin-like phospholipase RssA [Candidatus Thiodiazotropha sp. (ex Monitilora ramsayi)]|nr:patatin-like phospholipase RssA [Candidatus Thiodiazotropha sp. (ex Monitilora ramsayi)]